jgi:hypothetical protein
LSFLRVFISNIKIENLQVDTFNNLLEFVHAQLRLDRMKIIVGSDVL